MAFQRVGPAGRCPSSRPSAFPRIPEPLVVETSHSSKVLVRISQMHSHLQHCRLCLSPQLQDPIVLRVKSKLFSFGWQPRPRHGQCQHKAMVFFKASATPTSLFTADGAGLFDPRPVSAHSLDDSFEMAASPAVWMRRMHLLRHTFVAIPTRDDDRGWGDEQPVAATPPTSSHSIDFYLFPGPNIPFA